MSETLRDLVVSLSLQTDNFTRNIRSVNKQIQEAESRFKLASAGVENFEKTAQGLTARLDTLQSKLSLQKEVVDQYQRALEAARNKLSECYTRQGEYAQRLVDAQQNQAALNAQLISARDAYADCKNRLGEADQATMAASAHLEEIKNRYAAATAEVAKLAGQCEALKRATQNAADAVSQGNVNLNKASAAVKQTEADIQSTNRELQLAQTQWQAAGEAIRVSENAVASIGKQMQSAEASFRLATVGIRDVDSSATGLSERLTLLQSNLQNQNRIVQEYENILRSAREQLAAAQQVNDPDKIRQATDAVTDAETALKGAQTAVKLTEQAITECNSQLQLANNGWFSAAESIRASETAITSIGNQMKLAESQFTLATAGMKDTDTSVAGLTARLSLLQDRLTLQTQAVREYGNILAQAQTQLAAAQAAGDPEKVQQATDAVTRAQTALNSANASIKTTQAEIAECNAALQLADTNWYTAGETIQRSQAAIASIGKEIQQAESEFRLASVGIQNLDQSATGLSAKLDMLADKWALQREAVAQAETALQAAQEQLAAAQAVNDPDKIRQASDAVTDARTALNDARTALAQTEQEIANTNQALSLAETDWYAAGRAIDESKAAIASLGKQMQIAENNFRASTAGIRDMDTSVTGLSQKIAMLQSKLTLQQEAVRHYEDALAAARVQLEAAQDANDPDRIREATNAVEDAEVSLSRAHAEVAQTRAELDQTNTQLRTASSMWTSLGAACEGAGKRLEAAGKSAEKIGKALSKTVTTPIVALGAASVKASLDFESSFASVRKTVEATEAEYDQLAAASKRMSTQVASSTTDINEVMATGGQLGIHTENLAEFTRVMIDLGNSCEDLNADDAATQLAKFANIMGTDQSKFENMGSTVVDLGNNFATTENAIVTMAMRLAGAGKQVGLTEAQVLGFATALSSVGIEAQMGGSAFSKALVKMEVAAAQGGQALDDFARVSGMTAEQFKALWDSDPAAAFQAFIVGLSKLDEEGESAIVTLNDIGISEIRLRDTLLRSVNATELFSDAQARATKAWKENTALSTEAGKRYATTESKLKNLKNTAVLFGQQIGDDLNPTIQSLIDKGNALLEKFLALDEAQRMQIIQWAGIAAAAGPAIALFGKASKGIGTVAGGIGKFATAVGKAGGGVKGFLSVLGKSPAVWLAVTAAVVAGTVALVDYASGAKKVREALEGMQRTAADWKNTAADTFYGKSEGLSFFGMSAEDFKRDETSLSAQEWLDGLIAVWTDGEKESNAIVRQWTDSFKELTAATRTELAEMKATAEEAGYSGVSEQIQGDIDALDAMDAEIEKLLKKRQSKFFSEKDKVRLQELIDTREAIEVKYNLSPADTGGFAEIGKKLQAEVARAQAQGLEDAPAEVYENALVACAEGMAAVNEQIDAQYDKEYALIQLMDDEGQKQTALDELNARYREQRLAGAREYADAMAGVVMPVWNQRDIQDAATSMDELTENLSAYLNALGTENEQNALVDLNKTVQGLDEGALTEYYTLLTQIQSLLDSGMSEEEVAAMFPEIDFSGPLEQLASIQATLNAIPDDANLDSLRTMFGEALPEEVVKIATDLDMTGAQTRWDEFAANPGAITTDAVISGFGVAEGVEPPKVRVIPMLSGYDLTAYSRLLQQHPVEVRAVARFSDVYESLEAALNDPSAKFYSPDGTIIPVSAIVEELKDPDGILTDENGKEFDATLILNKLVSGNASVVIGDDGAAHVLLTAEFTGTREAIEEASRDMNEAFTTVSVFGKQSRHDWGPLNDIFGGSLLDWMNGFNTELEAFGKNKGSWITLWGLLDGGWLSGIDKRMNQTFSGENLGALTTYVSEVVAAIRSGAEVSEEDLSNLQAIVNFLSNMELTDTGAEIRATIAAGMTEAGWETDAETVAESLGTALDTAVAEKGSAVGESVAAGVGEGAAGYDFTADADSVAANAEDAMRTSFDSHSPSQRMVPLGADVAAGIGQGASGYDFSSDAAAMAAALESAVIRGMAGDALSSVGRQAAQGVADAMAACDMSAAGAALSASAKSALSANLNASALRSIGVSAMSGLKAGINAGKSGVVSAMRTVARAAVSAAKTELKIASPSRVFRDEVGKMAMKGLGEGVLRETKEQARVIRNAARFLTGEARTGAIAYNTSDNRRTYNQTSSVSLSGNNFYIRDEQDAYALAVEIAALTRRRQRGQGLKMA